MDDDEIAANVIALPVRFADRVDSDSLAVVREYARVGEWGEALDLLLACLERDRRAVTAVERDNLLALLHAMGLPASLARGLRVVHNTGAD
jgi:hypothetical protein